MMTLPFWIGLGCGVAIGLGIPVAWLVIGELRYDANHKP